MELRGLHRASVDGSEDNGPFFDLEFASALVEEEGLRWSDNQKRNAGAATQLAFSSSCSLRRDLALSFSASRGLCFKGHLVTVDASKSSSKPQVPAFLVKLSAFKLWFHRRSKSASLETNPGGYHRPPSLFPEQSNFLFKFKVEDVPPRASLLARDNSWRSSSRRSAAASPTGSNKKKLPSPSDMLQRYLSKIKPLYMRISKRYGEKLRQFAVAPSSIGGDAKVRPGAGEGGSNQTKHQSSFAPTRLRKSRSTSVTGSVRSPLATAQRRDDSFIEQQDGIQRAIAHCKRSFNRGNEELVADCVSALGFTTVSRPDSTRRAGSLPLLTRSRSDPGDGRSAESSCGFVLDGVKKRGLKAPLAFAKAVVQIYLCLATKTDE
ncbi:hypothetical protein ZIOFF_053484 [Zingiber officinale]|uniref:Membrane-associated kinase regulator 2 n=1 Tax=Zingiber officinale TaxID=94328 RepID=A0A8J5FCF4_ZINOF|nr:hypothetical protein ZIOFF_053484 [Zingiber officinale]